MIKDVVVKDAGNKGKGVFALRDFARGDILFRRRYSRVVRNSKLAQLSEEDQRHKDELDWEFSVIMLPPGCYINHSCNPNAILKGNTFYAWKAIQQGEEITQEYRVSSFTGERWECFCGSANCLGYVISDFFSMSEDQQRMYFPYAPKFIQQEYRRRQASSSSQSPKQ